MLALTDILQPQAIKVPLEADNKQGAIFELADLLAEQAGLGDPSVLREAVWQREQTRTTGIGHGIAIPHGKIDHCDKLVMGIGLCRPPIEFGAIDGNPVDLIFLLASPADQTGPHIQALASISRMLTDVEFRSAIKQAQSAEEIYELIVSRQSQTASA